MSKTAEWFEEAEGKYGRYIRLKDGAPDWLRGAVYTAHHEELPNDWVYGTCREVAALMDDGHDNADDIADVLCDVYTNELVAWVGKCGDPLHWMDEAIELMGTPKSSSDLLCAAQGIQLQFIAQTLLEAAEQAASDDE